MADNKRVARPGRGIVVLLVVVSLLAGGVYVLMTRPAMKPGAPSWQATPEAAPGDALRKLRAVEDENLTTYGWLDRENGIVHIPIDRALDMVLERGLPTRPQPTPQPNEVF